MKDCCWKEGSLFPERTGIFTGKVLQDNGWYFLLRSCKTFSFRMKRLSGYIAYLLTPTQTMTRPLRQTKTQALLYRLILIRFCPHTAGLHLPVRPIQIISNQKRKMISSIGRLNYKFAQTMWCRHKGSSVSHSLKNNQTHGSSDHPSPSAEFYTSEYSPLSLTCIFKTTEHDWSLSLKMFQLASCSGAL